MISFTQAAKQALSEHAEPVMSDYVLGVLLSSLIIKKAYKNQAINIRSFETTPIALWRRILQIEKEKIILPDEDFTRGRMQNDKVSFGKNVWQVIGAPKCTAEDVACLIDPFCYVSHLSAMQRYSLSNRSPKNLTISTPGRQQWMSLRDEFTQSAFGEPSMINHQLRRISLPKKIRGRQIEIHSTRYPKKMLNIADTYTRISSIGDTFVDMLERPDLCGGITHVLDVWEGEAKLFLDEIVQAVEVAPKTITKVRAGYILNERLGIIDSRIDKWLEHAKRGGSQKLDSNAAYVPTYSEKWMISINV